MRSKHFNLSWVLACAVMLCSVASCEKMNLGDSSSGDEEGANVIVSIRSFEQTPFESRTRTAVSDLCSHLNFVVFNQDGERVDQKDQEIDDEDFGKTHFMLPVGDYLLAVVAHSSNGNPSVNKRSAKKGATIGFTNAKGYTDTFFAAKSLTVGDDSVHLDMGLKRVVAKVRFVNSDAIPEKADTVRIYYEGGSGTLDVENGGWGNTNSKQMAMFPKSTFSDEFTIYTIPWPDKNYLKEVNIVAFRGSDRLTSTVIDSIPIRRNCITTCRGNIFDGKVTKVSFTITVDDEWGTPIEYEIPAK